jgi:hypothetical protein
MSNSKNSGAGISTLDGLMAQAMDASNLMLAKSQTAFYAKGNFIGDPFGGTEASKVKALKNGNYITLNAFTWAHTKQIDRQTRSVALPDQVGLVIGLAMDSPSIALFTQSLYTSTAMTDMVVQMTRTSKKSGDLEIFGTAQLNNIDVCNMVYQGYAESGPTVFIALLPANISIEVGGKVFTYDFEAN